MSGRAKSLRAQKMGCGIGATRRVKRANRCFPSRHGVFRKAFARSTLSVVRLCTDLGGRGGGSVNCGELSKRGVLATCSWSRYSACWYNGISALLALLEKRIAKGSPLTGTNLGRLNDKERIAKGMELRLS